MLCTSRAFRLAGWRAAILRHPMFFLVLFPLITSDPNLLMAAVALGVALVVGLL
jgi:hypothetical protein